MNNESRKLGRYRKLLNEEAGTPFEIREMWIAAFEEMLRIVDENLQLEGYDRDNALDNVRRVILDELGKAGDARDAVSVVGPSSICPFVFGGEDCGYNESLIYHSCDKTFKDCKRLGNVTNFGGIGYNKIPDAKEPGMIVEDSPEECDKKAAAVHESFSDYTTRRAWEVVMPTKQEGEDYCDCRHDDNCSDKMRGRCASTPNLERKERLKSRDKCNHEIAKSIVTTYGDGSRTIKCKKCGYITEYGRE